MDQRTGSPRHKESVKALLSYPHVSGIYIWTGFDYPGEPTPYSWPARSYYFGIIDLAVFQKMCIICIKAYLPIRRCCTCNPHWNWKQGDTVDVVACYNNANEVELFQNVISLGIRRNSGDELHVKWRVPFTPGTLGAVSRKAGKTGLTKEIKTAGASAKIMLKADRNKIKADGTDSSFITATIVDAAGVMVPDADNGIQFEISGAGFIAGVDNGSPISHEPFKSDKHTALNGRALAIVQSNGKKGAITFTASAEGLQSSTLVVNMQ